MSTATSPFLNKKQSAARLHCGVRKIERLIEQDKLRPVGDKGDRVLIPIEEQIRYEEELRARGRNRSIEASTAPRAAKPPSKKGRGL